MFKHITVALVLVALVAGCGPAGVRLPGTGEPPDQLITSVGDVGGLGCVSFSLFGKPSDVALARMAVGQLKSVLASPNPAVSAFGVVCTQAPEKFSAICAVAISRVAAHIGGMDILPKDSDAFKALDAFTSACAQGLGA